MSNQVELVQPSSYLIPSNVIVYQENEFLVEFKTVFQADCGIKRKPITLRNSQANYVLDRVHQIIGYIINIFKVQDMILNDENP